MTWYEARVTVRVESAEDQSEVQDAVDKAARGLGGELIDVEPPQPADPGVWDVTAVVSFLSGDTADDLRCLIRQRAKSAFGGLSRRWPPPPPTVTVRQVKQRRGWN